MRALLVMAALLSASPVLARTKGDVATPAFAHALPNVPGKKLVAVRVDYAPGAKSAAHHHAPSAFVYAYILAGSIRSQVGSTPVQVFHAGESFYEDPGEDHRISENASETKSASLLAVFVVDQNDTNLTQKDAQ